MTESKAPLISICTPSYNMEPYIRDMIESVLAQTFSDWELIITDDHSTDNTVEIIRTYTDPRIKLFLNERNLGAAKNYNHCLKHARGTYSKVLCGDDIIYPHCLEKQLEGFQTKESQNTVLVSCKRDILDNSGRKIFSTGGFGKLSGTIPSFVAMRQIVRSGTNPIGEPSCGLFKTDLFRSQRGFNEKMGYMIDLDLWCRLLQKGDLYFIPDPLCGFRIAKNSWSITIGKNQSHQAISFLKRLAALHSNTIRLYDLYLGILNAKIKGQLRQILYFYLKYFR